MGFEDTVMKLSNPSCTLFNDICPVLIEGTNLQAEISYKAGMKQGIWLFAWWKDGEQYVGTSGRTLKEAYKELGIE